MERNVRATSPQEPAESSPLAVTDTSHQGSLCLIDFSPLKDLKLLEKILTVLERVGEAAEISTNDPKYFAVGNAEYTLDPQGRFIVPQFARDLFTESLDVVIVTNLRCGGLFVMPIPSFKNSIIFLRRQEPIQIRNERDGVLDRPLTPSEWLLANAEHATIDNAGRCTIPKRMQPKKEHGIHVHITGKGHMISVEFKEPTQACRETNNSASLPPE